MDGPFVRLVKVELAIHRPVDDGDSFEKFQSCSADRERWPCQTFQALEGVAEPCRRCGGTKYVVLEHEGGPSIPCPDCNGTGKDYLAKARWADHILSNILANEEEFLLTLKDVAAGWHGNPNLTAQQMAESVLAKLDNPSGY